MRNTLILLFFTFSFIQMNAQEWVRQHPFPIFEQMHDIALDDEGRGWAVGGNSTILHTDNWGVNWTIQQPVNLGVVLLSIEIIPGSDSQKALIGGNTLLKTEDGGQNWEQVLGFTNPVEEIVAVDDQNIYVFGYNDTSRKSTDGGETWIEFPNPAASGSMVGCFIDPMNGWASGGTYENAQVYRTSDGGENWTLLDTTKHVGIENIQMLDSQKGFMASYDHIFKTFNGGTTWTIISDQNLPSVTDFHAVNEDQLWASMHNGSVYSTLNGGTSWTLEYIDIFSGNKPNGIYATTGGQAWIAGKYTSILYTASSGENWQDQTPGNKNSLQDIDFYDDDHGFACGIQNTLIKTDDGGAIWQELSLPAADETFLAIEMTSPETIYVLTDQADVQKSVNAGESWTTIGEDLFILSYGMEVISDEHICAYSQFGTISTTMNGGNTWTEYAHDGRAYDINFPTENTGWIASNQGNALKTTDGGLSWNTIPVNNDDEFHAIHFVDEMEGWVIGRYVDSLFHTTNGGESWDVQELPGSTYWQEISFINRDTGWIVGGSSGYSRIVTTTDGGQNWVDVYSDGAQLQGVSTLNSNKVWAAGAGGSIIHFSPCNVIPQVSNLTGEQQLCEGDTVQYQVNSENVTVFDWQLPADWTFLSNSNTALIEVLVGSEAGNVQLIGQNSCDLSSDPVSIEVTVANATDIDLVVGGNNMLEVSPTGTSYTWYLNGQIINQSSNNTWAAQETGLYHVIVTFETGCSATSGIVSIMITGSEEQAIQNAIHLFPNPTKGLFQLRLPTEVSNAQITILDNTARPLLQKSYNSQMDLDLSDFSAGIYYVKINTDQGVFYKRVLLL